jgi:hypothetical protein
MHDFDLAFAFAFFYASIHDPHQATTRATPHGPPP